ncbi:MAG: hypothetical protein ACOVT5_01650 [Armatimonadaceae bacterium]
MPTISVRPVLAAFALATALVGSIAPANAQFLVDDAFDILSPAWTIQRGTASIADGWVRLQGDGGIPRDAFVMTGEGSDWTDYRLVTRFHSDGGGDNWFNALINFRVKELTGWSDGTWYGFYIYPPNSNIPPSGGFFLAKKTGIGYEHLTPLVYDPSSLLVGDNLVDIEVRGGLIELWLNSRLAATYYDPDPIPSGGVALGAIWESVTRYDFVKVIKPYSVVEERISKKETVHKTGSVAPLRFRVVDNKGVNKSSPKTPVAVLRVRNTDTGAVQKALGPGPDAKPRPATAQATGQAYQVNLNTKGMASGNWQMEVSVNDDPRPHPIRFKLR